MKPDWLEGTIHTVHYQAALDSVKELLGEMQELPYGQHGYTHGAIVVGLSFRSYLTARNEVISWVRF